MCSGNRHFPSQSDPGAVITYEYPLKERIRTLLRLEDLYRKLEYFTARDNAEEHHVALITLFEILEVAKRGDLKVDLMQELERQRQILTGFRNNPDISEEALTEALEEIAQAAASLQRAPGKIGQCLRENEWLMTIRSRAGIPGGVCEFDLPAYHYWLSRASLIRRHDLQGWIQTLMPICDGLTIVLRLLRASAQPETQVAHHGVYQSTMTSRSAQMLRVDLPSNEAVLPEISASRHALSIRFLMPEMTSRSQVAKHDISFQLSLCSL